MMANNIRYDKTARVPSQAHSRHGRRVFSEKTGALHQQTINHLSNWRYYNPLFLYQGYHDMPDIGTFYVIMDPKIKRDSSSPGRRIAFIADYFSHDSGVFDKNLFYYDQDSPGFPPRYWRLTNIIHAGAAHSPSYDDTYTTYPEVYTGGAKSIGGFSDWEPLVYTPTAPGANFEHVILHYENQRFFGIGMYEIPDNIENITALQMGCEAKQVDYNRIIKGDDATRTGTNYGALWDYLGNRANNVDTVECMTRRQWQYCHPQGIYLNSTLAYTNIFNELKIKIRPRQILDDSRKVKYKCVVMSEGDDYLIQFKNLTYADNITDAFTTDATVTLHELSSTLLVERGEDNEIEINVWTTSGNAVSIHSVAMFEQDPWDTIA